ncbi:LuxR family transcriptional regulator [Mesorhizobium sp. B2-1-8]|uniref:LuxR family transcriptional regulator n=1 Tax=unclassified Mesorhizobium TaxID=325217 RepID=UPI001127D2CA|nr:MULTISPECIES: LuxR family transcriptional regulator [unclassified Mesorhizobium]MBZ9673774.1 LuxR family transcriptional regulator [Mesorhizobium sp. ES1-3]TPI25777.1 LuxR family transcriptional regulator [Mesorhizobium sp. B3-2-1]UCI16740.1 LuxR family transcriptional regulator [Mesorhizobium sp. B2-1-8]
MENEIVVDLFAAISKIDTALSADAILQEFRSALARYGLRSFLITGLPVPHDTDWQREILGDGWPLDWYRRYVSEDHFLHDPCVAQCRHSPEPFLWRELPAAKLSTRAKLVMDEAAEFGMREGICVPIHVPLSGPSVVTAASDGMEVAPREMPVIETLCVHTFRSLSALGTPGDGDEPMPLTARERELLEWSAQGKSTDDIACILGVTRNTVESHQRNIRGKLDAINVSHAIVKALRRQEIQI